MKEIFVGDRLEVSIFSRPFGLQLETDNFLPIVSEITDTKLRDLILPWTNDSPVPVDVVLTHVNHLEVFQRGPRYAFETLMKAGLPVQLTFHKTEKGSQRRKRPQRDSDMPYRIGDEVSVFSTRDNRWYNDGKISDVNLSGMYLTVHYRFSETGRVEKKVDLDELKHFIRLRKELDREMTPAGTPHQLEEPDFMRWLRHDIFAKGRWKKYVMHLDADDRGVLEKRDLLVFFHKIIRLYEKRQGNEYLPSESETKPLVETWSKKIWTALDGLPLNISEFDTIIDFIDNQVNGYELNEEGFVKFCCMYMTKKNRMKRYFTNWAKKNDDSRIPVYLSQKDLPTFLHVLICLYERNINRAKVLPSSEETMRNVTEYTPMIWARINPQDRPNGIPVGDLPKFGKWLKDGLGIQKNYRRLPENQSSTATSDYGLRKSDYSFPQEPIDNPAEHLLPNKRNVSKSHSINVSKSHSISQPGRPSNMRQHTMNSSMNSSRMNSSPKYDPEEDTASQTTKTTQDEQMEEEGLDMHDPAVSSEEKPPLSDQTYWRQRGHNHYHEVYRLGESNMYKVRAIASGADWADLTFNGDQVVLRDDDGTYSAKYRDGKFLWDDSDVWERLEDHPIAGIWESDDGRQYEIYGDEMHLEWYHVIVLHDRENGPWAKCRMLVDGRIKLTDTHHSYFGHPEPGKLVWVDGDVWYKFGYQVDMEAFVTMIYNFNEEVQEHFWKDYCDADAQLIYESSFFSLFHDLVCHFEEHYGNHTFLPSELMTNNIVKTFFDHASTLPSIVRDGRFAMTRAHWMHLGVHLQEQLNSDSVHEPAPVKARPSLPIQQEPTRNPKVADQGGRPDVSKVPQESQQLVFTVPDTPYSAASPYSTFDDESIRQNWKEGDYVDVFSNTHDTWMQGYIHNIGHDDYGEFIEVHYFDESNKHRSKKRLQRFDKDVRPFIEDAQYHEKDLHWPKLLQNDMKDNHDVREKWKQGSLIEVYSRSKESWFVGYIHTIGSDDLGEYIDIHYQDPETRKLSRKRLSRHEDQLRPVQEERDFVFCIICDELVKKHEWIEHKSGPDHQQNVTILPPMFNYQCIPTHFSHRCLEQTHKLYYKLLSLAFPQKSLTETIVSFLQGVVGCDVDIFTDPDGWVPGVIVEQAERKLEKRSPNEEEELAVKVLLLSDSTTVELDIASDRLYTSGVHAHRPLCEPCSDLDVTIPYPTCTRFFEGRWYQLKCFSQTKDGDKEPPKIWCWSLKDSHTNASFKLG